MATYLSVPEFNSTKCTWEEWCEIIEHALVASGITNNNKRRNALLSSCGTETYQLIRAVVQPDKPADKTFDELVTLLKYHFTPKPSEIVQRFKFHSRSRKVGERIVSYVAALRKLSDGCNFGDNLKDMLRDRLVCGVGTDSIQRKLLAESTLTFEDALKIASAMEMADRNFHDIHHEKPNSSVNFVNRKYLKSAKPSQPNTKQTCYRCGKDNHQPDACFYKTERCHNVVNVVTFRKCARVKRQ